MKIAIFCTNEYTTPPPKNVIYAPLNIASAITEGLVAKKHQVYLFAARGSKTKAKLITDNLLPLRKNPLLPKLTDRIVGFYEQKMLSTLFRMAQKNKFDIIHIHPIYRTLPFISLVKTPVVFTIHDPFIDKVDYWKKEFLKIYQDTPAYFISISDQQRKAVPWLNYAATIYNGVDLKKFKFNPSPKNYFLSVGRIRPEKGVHHAVNVCRKSKENLLIIGKIEDQKYWNKKIKPYLGKNIKYLGTLSREKIIHYFISAKGFLFPVNWEEPFGLVMIEAMAGGTPIIAFRRGSVPEVIQDKKTGFIVKNEKEMASVLKKIKQIKRNDCRSLVEKKFSEEKMVDGYEKIYYKILKKEKNKKVL